MVGYANLVPLVQLYADRKCESMVTESIDSYDDLKKAFLENYLQQKKYIKDRIELHNIKQRDGESTEGFMKRYKLESRDPQITSERSCFRHGSRKRVIIRKTSEKKVSGTSKDRKGSRIGLRSSQKLLKKFCFRKRKIQGSTANDDSGREAESHQILVVDGVVQAVAPTTAE
nr:reverse transcriptase domain-containing protein [Tanacetum cinerariifolium]